MKTAIGLMLVLALVGCGGDETGNGATEIDAGTGGALAGDAGTGGTGGHAADGSGGAAVADGGGTGGAIATGTGGAGSGGAVGSGGAQGSGGSAGGAGGATPGTGGSTATACAVPAGWHVNNGSQCMKPSANGFTGTKKNGILCTTNCQSVRPNGAAGSYVGPPTEAECTAGDYVCVASCGECS